MYSDRSTRALPRVSFLIRRSRDQRSVSTSPGLIAAAHVLHRLLAPRHPPCALVLLIRKEHVDVAMEFSRCARVDRARAVYAVPASSLALHEGRTRSTRARSFKAQQRAAWLASAIHTGERGRRCSRRIRSSDVEGHEPHGINESDSLRSKSSGFPRKEVIQPHLPVRLPCYDFTPIINPTFDGCLP